MQIGEARIDSSCQQVLLSALAGYPTFGKTEGIFIWILSQIHNVPKKGALDSQPKVKVIKLTSCLPMVLLAQICK